ncbi:MAG TPA: glycosyltransferase family 2 protein [Spirochaetota bacterium]|nr:glycosyltransferase family 2 protein [Spirochaetota bacterium]HNT11671.1 glycosyltransferase family 2 protein [Spirochaetota bacterium]
MDKVYIVIPVFNRIERTTALLSSLAKQRRRPAEIVVVDDGSTDGTAAIIARDFPAVTLIRGTGDWWWSASVNRGIEHVLARADVDHDHVLHINNDVVIKDRDFIGKIVACHERHPRSLIVPRTVLLGENREFPTGVIFSWETPRAAFVTELDIRGSGGMKFLDALFTKTILMPCIVFRRIGLFDEDVFPQYQGDTDFTARAKAAGFSLIKDESIVIYNYNDPKDSGIHFKELIGTRDLFNILFSIRSSENLFKNARFIMRHCPRRYRARNVAHLLMKTVYTYLRKTRLARGLGSLKRRR